MNKPTDNQEWQSSPFELEPDKFWTDDDTNELVCAATGERFTVSSLMAQRDAAVAALRAVVKAIDINALKLGEGDSGYFNYAGKRVISEARAAIAAAEKGQ